MTSHRYDATCRKQLKSMEKMESQIPSIESLSDLRNIESTFVKLAKPKDFIRGTLVGVSKIKSEFSGLMDSVYEVKVQYGLCHKLDADDRPIEPGISAAQGEYVKIWGGKKLLDDLMKKIKIGQEFALIYNGMKESKSGKTEYASFTVKAGLMDPDYLSEEERMIRESGV